jgi:lysophospholipase L1-like esterase
LESFRAILEQKRLTIRNFQPRPPFNLPFECVIGSYIVPKTALSAGGLSFDQRINVSNMVKKHTIYWVLSMCMVASACKQREAKGPLNGEANLSKYVAFGDSYTAGYTDAGLYREGQLASYPNVLAQQFKQGGGGEFLQPLFPIGKENGTGFLKLSGVSATGVPNLVEVRSGLGVRSTNPTLYTEYTEPIQNWGVPGMALGDIRTAGYSTANPFFERLLPATAKNKSYLEVVSETSPTFFTCWIGINDVLSFATSGGTRPLTDAAVFTTNCKELFAVLASKQAKGVVANLFDVTQAPYFGLVTVVSLRGQNNATVYIRTGKGTVRAATDKDLIMPSAANTAGIPNNSGIPKGYFPNYPLDNTEVLDSDEVAQIQERIAVFNGVIEAETKARNIPLLNANEGFGKLKAGIVENGQTLNNVFLTGGIYSLDGIHLTPRGNAWLANEFLKVINQTYKARFELLDLNKYDGVKVKQ